ncbi:hypothetical protein D6201_03680 [Aurantiacibacter aquimixticola]|uniref:Uncharacterized protein n=2 Tax=Aurantiacibacter aquimixticola TaxID=1958945 RepID=A0A419RS00_9SPHN|nr:hypothetical protein D6201_03680 [Aurantiacibacter aquimixticola]
MACSTPVSASAQSEEAVWHKISVTGTDALTVETPCTDDEIERRSDKGTTGILCRIGEQGFGAAITTNGLGLNEKSGETFESMLAELRADAGTVATEEFVVEGLRSVRGWNSSAPDPMTAQLVELAPGEILVLMTINIEGAYADSAGGSLPAETIRFFNSLEFAE